VDANLDWEALANPSWALDPWATWLRADPDRRLILAVPMLLTSSAGSFADTSHDVYFVRLARAIANRGIAGQVVIRLGYEMNGDWMPYGRQYDPDGAGFRAMWQRIVPLMRAVFPFPFDWCVVPGDRPTDAERFYPGDDVVDVIGFDLYDSYGSGDPYERWADMATRLEWVNDFADGHSKPLALDEWAVWNPATAKGGGDNPLYVTNLLRWAAEHDVLWTSYFDSTEGGVNTTLEQNPNSLNAFRQVMAGG
jgi:hypothetical protein